MDMIVAVISAAVFGAGALVVFKAGPFLDQAFKVMGKKRIFRGADPIVHRFPGAFLPGKTVEEEENP